jgi:hypothetical protein
MGSIWTEPRWLIGVGVVLLAGGYAVLQGDPTESRAVLASGRVAFYVGLVLLMCGVGIWLQRPPRPDPLDSSEEDGSLGDD